MKKTLLALTHPDEWNQLLPFNSYIKSIKDNYEKVIAVVPYKGYVVISEADEIITVNDGDFFSYPNVLDTPDRKNESFIQRCVEYCKEKYGEENLDIKSWQGTNYDTGIVNESILKNYEIYITSFTYAKNFLDSESTIKPTKEVFEQVKAKYGKLFDENTFIVMTRNFTNKALVHNTINSVPDLEERINYLTDKGLKIINIGFPPQNYNIEKNYTVLHEDLTQDELISLFYLSRGVLIGADAGGFATHFASNVDFYLTTDEWSKLNTTVDISLAEAKKTNFNMFVNSLTKEELYDVLIANGKEQDKVFSEPKKITII